MNFPLFLCPIFLGHPKSERPLIPKRAGALWERHGRDRHAMAITPLQACQLKANYILVRLLHDLSNSTV
jgi:hypothetical protein